MTQITGHRGARNLWPENSLSGFRNAAQLGVDAIEFDVHLTEAGELAVIHDPTLERTTEGAGPVRKLTREARAKTRLKGTEEGIPTLCDVLSVLAPCEGLQLHVEIKLDETATAYPGIVGQVVNDLARFGVEDRSCLTSFEPSVLEECRRCAPHIARLVSVNAGWAERQGGLAAFLDRLDPLVQIVAIHHELLEAEWALIRERLPLDRLCVWTVNDTGLIRRWLQRGVGHLTSDNPDRALALRARVDDLRATTRVAAATRPHSTGDIP